MRLAPGFTAEIRSGLIPEQGTDRPVPPGHVDEADGR